MNGSSAATRDGVSTRESVRRSTSWRGGSMWKRLSGRRLTSMSIKVPFADENVFGSRAALFTSSARLSIQ